MSITASPASSTVVASALPLTTTFSPSPDCFTAGQLFPTSLTAGVTLGASIRRDPSAYYRLGRQNVSECMPSGWSYDSYYSPGLCPFSYHIATSSVDEAAAETHAYCCPSDLGFNTATSGERDIQRCKVTTLAAPGVTPLYAPAVSIRWRADDFSQPSLSGVPKEKPHMATSQKIGIGIGVTVGVLVALIIGLNLFFLRHRQLRSRTAEQPNGDQYEEKRLKRTFSYWKITTIDSWLYEVIAICFSVACFVAMVYILQVYDQQPQPRFSYGLTLNTIVSVLATSSKSSLIFLVGECIGQLRWVSFRGAPKPLFYAQTYDSASRGPWGSFLLLFKDKCRSPATIGAIVTILALAFDPFAQQIIIYDVRVTDQFSSAAKVTQSRGFTVPIVDQQPLEYINALQTAVWTNQTALNPVCPSGHCTWPLFKSVEVCSRCEDVTQDATFSECEVPTYISENVTPRAFCGLTLANRILPNYTQLSVSQGDSLQGHQLTLRVPFKTVWPASDVEQNKNSGWYWQNGTKASNSIPPGPNNLTKSADNMTYAGVMNPLVGFGYAEIEVPNMKHILQGSLNTGLDKDKFNAAYPILRALNVTKVTECALSFCARTYNVSVSGGIPSTTVLDEDFGTFYDHENSGKCWKSDSKIVSQAKRMDPSIIENTGQYAVDSTHFEFSYNAATPNGIFGDFSLTGGVLNEFGCTWNGHCGEANGESNIDGSSAATTKVMSDGLENTMRYIASSLSHYARQSSNTTVLGTVTNTKSYVHVRWNWLILPGVLLVLGTMLLVATAFISTKASLWKTSVLPFLYHGLGNNLIARDNDLGTVSQMEQAAGSTIVSLEHSNIEHRLMLTEAHDS